MLADINNLFIIPLTFFVILSNRSIKAPNTSQCKINITINQSINQCKATQNTMLSLRSPSLIRRRKKANRFSYSPTHVLATGRARGRHVTELQDAASREEVETPPSTPSPSSGSSQSITTPDPRPKRVKFSPTQREPVLEAFLLNDPNASHANTKVVQQQRIHVKKTPKMGSRRHRDVSNIVALGLERLGSEIFDNPKWTSNQRKDMMKPHSIKYFGKNKGEPYMCSNKNAFHMYILLTQISFCCIRS